MSTPKKIIADLGDDAIALIAAAVYKSEKSVRNAAAGPDALFPAAWFEQVKALCDERGVECPTLAFSFVRGTDTAKKTAA